MIAARHLHPRECPYQGRHDILPKPTTCPTYLLSGCNRSSDLHITSACNSIPGKFIFLSDMLTRTEPVVLHSHLVLS